MNAQCSVSCVKQHWNVYFQCQFMVSDIPYTLYTDSLHTTHMCTYMD